MTEPANARDLFRAAYEHRYTWDATFPGYTADIELKQGEEVYTGHVAIKPDMTVEVSGIADEECSRAFTPKCGTLLPTASAPHLKNLTAKTASPSARRTAPTLWIF